MASQEKVVLVSAPIVSRKVGNKIEWLIVKQGGEDEWEIPKTLVRRGESSVRASIRVMAEQGGMRAKVLEEVGRGGGAAKINGKPVTKRYLFYILLFKEGGEILGYEDAAWLEFSKALKKLTNKRDIAMLKDARDLHKQLEKDGRFLKEEEDEEFSEVFE
jgi:ADP-ribose pyrophosphatase YjhB (NUDIX family)